MGRQLAFARVALAEVVAQHRDQDGESIAFVESARARLRPFEREHEVQRLAEFWMPALRASSASVELQRELGHQRLQQPDFVEVHEEPSRRRAVQQRGSQFERHRFLRQRIEDGQRQVELADRVVDGEAPLARLAVVAHPTDRVLAHALRCVATRLHAAFLPILDATARIVDRAVRERDGDGATRHVARAQIALDAHGQRHRRVRVTQRRDLTAQFADAQRDRAAVEVACGRRHEALVLLQQRTTRIDIERPREVDVLRPRPCDALASARNRERGAAHEAGPEFWRAQPRRVGAHVGDRVGGGVLGHLGFLARAGDCSRPSGKESWLGARR